MLDPETRKDIERKFKQQIVGYVTAALGLVAGLAWNDAVRSLIDDLFPIVAGKGSIWLKFGYAAIITLVVFLVGYYLLKLTEPKD